MIFIGIPLIVPTKIFLLFQAVVNYVYIYIHMYIYIYVYYVYIYVNIYIYIIDMYRYILYIIRDIYYIYIMYIHMYIYIYYRHVYLMIASSNLAASLLILYCSFSSLILSSALWSLFQVLSKRWHRKPNGLSDARVVSLAKKEYGFAIHFCVAT